MILSSGAGCFTATAGTTTMAAGNTTHEQQLQQQHEPQQLQQHQQSDESTTDFGWWQSQQSVNSLTGHQLPQITSSSPPQQQQFGAGDDFDGFDLSLLISGVSDGLYSDGAMDNRVPAAAISATVTVHTNTALNGSGDYYPPTTAVSQQQLQLDLQQLWSLYEEIRQSETSTSPAAVVPSVMDTTDVGTTATATPATTTTTAVAANNGEGNTTKSTLLRSLLTATVSSLPPVSSVPPVCKIESAAPVVESTTEVADAPSAVIDIKTENVEAADNKNHNKHRLLIEMLRGGSNDDVVVPTAVVRPTRRRPHVKAFGPDGADECKAGRRRLDSLPILQTDQIQGLQPDEADDDGLLMYESPYFTASCASPSWLDNMVAAAAAATTDEYNLCFDQASVDGGYYSATTAEYVYSPPAAAQVPSVSPPPSSCGDPSTTTIKIEDCSGMDEQMCWKTAEGTTGSGDFYDRVLMFVREAAASVASPNDDTAISSCIMSSSTDSNSSNSNSNSSVSNMNKISSMEGIQDDASIVSADSEDPDAMANSSFHLSDNLSSVSATSKSFTQTPGKASATVTVTTTTTSSSSSSSLSSPPNIHLWQFMKEMLTASEDDDNIATSTTTAAGTVVNPKQPMIRWLDRKEGIFKIEDSQAVARLWGQRKNRPLMNYDKLSRSLRQYYKKGIMRKTARSQRLVYQFCYPYNA